MPLTATTAPPRRLGFTRTMPRTPETVREARELVRAALAVWAMDELMGHGTLLVSELVTNSIRHTRCDAVRVTVSRAGPNGVRVAVEDASHDLPVARQARDDETGGRGLTLVDALTVRWGADPLPWGKRVWGEVGAESTE